MDQLIKIIQQADLEIKEKNFDKIYPSKYSDLAKVLEFVDTYIKNNFKLGSSERPLNKLRNFKLKRYQELGYYFNLKTIAIVSLASVCVVMDVALKL